jgi:hypothetical protein
MHRQSHIEKLFMAIGAISFAIAAIAQSKSKQSDVPVALALSWRNDPAWNQGKAEWALYDAQRDIYGTPRHYEATIFTNRELIDPATTTKTDDPAVKGAFEVFKHNVSEIIPTENYTYRFLTTCYVRSEDLRPYKLTMSSQEDCGSTYRQLVMAKCAVEARSFCYFPNAGDACVRYRAPKHLALADALTLTLRDYPFDEDAKPELAIALVADQTDNRETPMHARAATVRYAGREALHLPYGDVQAHRLRVEWADNKEHAADLWFAADATNMRRVLVKYDGAYGVKYELKKLGWWKYWDHTQPRPQ